MKLKALILATFISIILFAAISYGSSGDTWGPTSRQAITSIASQMIDSSWTPRSTVRNWAYGSVWYYFCAGMTYRGEAYCQQNAQENWAEFFSFVDNTKGGDTYFGNDCSGFVSISWGLPKRYTCTDFECDAINSTNPFCGPYHDPSTDDYAQSLGNVGSGGQVTLLQGDALVNSGVHIILFDKYATSGVVSMEQTPGPRVSSDEMRRYWSWSSLGSYRPIRRNLLGGPSVSGH
jgi:hypothetical protein